MKTMKTRYQQNALRCALVMSINVLLFGGCDYGIVGGADITKTLRDSEAAKILYPMVSVWYSHYGGRKLDSYRIGKWKDREQYIPEGKQKLFPDFDINNPKFKSPASALPMDDDYFIVYDDTVYEIDPGDGGNGGLADLVTRYIGIVRAVNIFNGDSKTGAIIIEYLDGAYPRWSKEILNTPLPFFGIYYRVIDEDCIQMANAVKLKEFAKGKPYHTETKLFEEVIEFNNAKNDQELIAWGIVTPQDREK